MTPPVPMELVAVAIVVAGSFKPELDLETSLRRGCLQNPEGIAQRKQDSVSRLTGDRNWRMRMHPQFQRQIAM